MSCASNCFHKGVFCCTHAVEWKHVFLRIIFVAAVYFTIHMDGQVWNHDQITVYIDQSAFECSGRWIFDDQTSGYGKRTVKPRRKNHAAVAFYIEFDIVFFYFHFWIFLNFKGRRVTVASHDAHTVKSIFRNRKSNDG